MEKDFTHLNEKGSPEMVDVSHKKETLRVAKARTVVVLPQAVMNRFESNDIHTPKGSVFQTAIIAGVMGAKRTSELIPLCHPIGMDDCKISINVVGENEVEIISEAKVFARTGVEMEAMCGASIAALTIYDMCKSFSHEIEIKETRLIEKTGGKSDFKATY